ncbi:hypothetical protein GYA49_01530 [Candidatus Beckwithbacteria bacterium]|nr:hypothetical protein [Candidatus Beckwithbacteria bacterium]
MARTKKYLSSPSSSAAKRGFYRPLRRISDKPAAKVVLSSAKNTINPDNATNTEIEELKAQIQKAQDLKAELEQKIKSELNDSSHEPTYQALSRNLKPQSAEEESEPQISHLKPLHAQQQETEEEPDFTSHSGDEKMLLLEKELNYALKKEEQFKHQISEMREELEKEREQMQHTIKNLRQDVRGMQPLHENKFFSISQELQEVVSAMNQLVETENTPTSSANNTTQTAVTPANQTNNIVTNQAAATPQGGEGSPAEAPTNTQPQPSANQPTPADQAPGTTTPETQAAQPGNTEPEPKKGGLLSKIPKPVKVLAIALIIVTALGGGAWYFLNRKTEVDTALLQEYLPEGVEAPQPQVAGDSTVAEPEPTAKPTPTPKPEAKNKGSTPELSLEPEKDKYEESQADISFADTKWDTYVDQEFGFELTYPKNVVNIVRTDSSITFIRKTGYVFKIQIIETALDLAEYWKLIKASSLSYKVKETTFRDKPALLLELEDFSDYPGDKYLVKTSENYVLDIWYATYSNTLSDDDAKRIDIMLNSMKFIDEKEE